MRKWGKTRTKIPDGAKTQVRPFPHTMQCRFRSSKDFFLLLRCVLFMFYLYLIGNKVGIKWGRVSISHSISL